MVEMEWAADAMVFLAIFVIVLIIYLFIKRVFFKQPRYDFEYTLPNGMKIGNSQLIGEKDSQNDCFTITEKDGLLFSAIADGMTDKPIGKYAASEVINVFKNNFLNGRYRKVGVKRFFEESIRLSQKNLHNNASGNKTGAMIAAVLVKDGELHYLSLGSCSIFLLRAGELIYINNIENHEIQMNKVKLAPKDIVLLCSSGAGNSLTERELLWHLSEANHPYGKCQDLLKLIRQKRLVNQDNATIIIMEQMV